jgi:hypothetical protein
MRVLSQDSDLVTVPQRATSAVTNLAAAAGLAADQILAALRVIDWSYKAALEASVPSIAADLQALQLHCSTNCCSALKGIIKTSFTNRDLQF